LFALVFFATAAAFLVVTAAAFLVVGFLFLFEDLTGLSNNALPGLLTLPFVGMTGAMVPLSKKISNYCVI
jgi:hypothetical protein